MTFKLSPTLLSHAFSISGFRSVVCLIACFAGGCTTPRLNAVDSFVSLDPAVRECLRAFEADERRIKRAGVVDAQYRRIRGYPFLRTNRFTASLTDRLNTFSATGAWIARLSELDSRGRAIEHLNLSADRSRFESDQVRLDRCRQLLTEQLASDPVQVKEIRNRTRVPDNYQIWSRRLGLYPITSWFVLRGVERLQAREGAKFDQATKAQKFHSRQKFGLRSTESLAPANIDEPAVAEDALGVPKLSQQRLAELFRRHQPVWSIDVQTSDDLIGTVHYDGDGDGDGDGDRIDVSTQTATVYTELTYTRFKGEILIQLNYTIWFPSRPKSGVFDILGGYLDGITWRVTLNSKTQVLFADAMHNCGCYYMAFPSQALQKRDRNVRLEEPLWIPKVISPDPASRAVIEVSSATHYIENVYYAKEVQIENPITVAAYDELRALATHGGGRKSMFSSEGIVTHSERGERWLLWPMGIQSAGAMRQQGHHPIAFVGRRHFDDPELIETYFDLAPAKGDGEFRYPPYFQSDEP